MVYCTVTVFLSTVSIYFSLYLYLSTVFTVHISSVFICIQIFLIVYCIYRVHLIYSIYLSTDLSYCILYLQGSLIYSIYLSRDLSYRILYLQGSLIYSIYLLCKAIFSALLSTVKMPFYLFYSALLYYCVWIYTLNICIQCHSILFRPKFRRGLL